MVSAVVLDITWQIWVIQYLQIILGSSSPSVQMLRQSWEDIFKLHMLKVNSAYFTVLDNI